MAAVYNKKMGIIMMLLSALAFSAMNVFSRMASDVPVMQRTFFRTLATAVVVLVIMRRRGIPIRIKKGTLKDHVLRSTLGIVSMIANFYAVDHMLLSDSTMILELNPFFAILMSVFMLGEKPSLKQLGFVLMAFTGAVFVVKPTLSMFTSGCASLIALLSAFMGGTAYTIVRKLTGKGESGLAVILFFSAYSALFCLPAVVFEPVEFTGFNLMMIAGIAVSGCLAQFFVTAAYSNAPAAEISFYDYSQLIFAAVFGYIFFDQMADIWSYIGYGIILCAALLVFLQGRQKVNS